MLIQKWGRSSAASTAVSIADAIKSLVTPTPEGDWFSTGVSFEAFELITALFRHSSNGKSNNNKKKTGLYDWKSLWHSRGYRVQHAMQIEGMIYYQIVLIIFVLR